MRTEPRVIYYKCVFKKTGKITYTTWTWCNDVEKFLKDNSGGAFEVVIISKEEFEELKKEK